MRGESMGQKEILQNYGTAENEKKKVDIENESRGKLERCVILAPCCLTDAGLD